MSVRSKKTWRKLSWVWRAESILDGMDDAEEVIMLAKVSKEGERERDFSSLMRACDSYPCMLMLFAL